MKRFISLFTILCCVLTFVSFPAMAENSTAIAFSDDFQSETDAVPDNWEVYNNQTTTTSVSIVTEDGNKFLRMQKINSTWGGEIMASTKAGVVSLPTAGKKIVVKMKMRGSDMRSGVSARHTIRLAYPEAPHTDDQGNEYILWAMRTHSSSSASFCYPIKNTHSLVADSGYLTAEKTWYDVTAVLDYSAKTIDYTIGNSSSGYRRFKAEFTGTSLGNASVIDNITMKLTNGATGFYTDIDDVSIEYLSEALEFEDTFENVQVNTAPENWVDRAGVSDIEVMEETNGNKFVRITKKADTKGVPQVATKDGVINIPWSDVSGKGIIIEAKIRPQNTEYRSLLMLNAPDLATDTQLGANYGTPFYINENLQPYCKPGWTAENAISVNEWLHYRAVIIPGEEKTEIRHYLNGEHKKTTYATQNELPELFNPQALSNIAFVWRHKSANPSAATATGYMDFDDIKVYEMKTFKHDVKFTDGNGAELNEIENGTVNVNASLINDGTERKLDVLAALYTKDESGNWIFTEAKSVVNYQNNRYLYAFGWRSGTASLSLNVTDAENQMIKVFVWHRAADSTPILVPVCAPYILD